MLSDRSIKVLSYSAVVLGIINVSQKIPPTNLPNQDKR